MEYNKDFDFYLLPSGDTFDEFLSQYNSKEEIPSYNKKDFAPIVDIAVKYTVFGDKFMYDKDSQNKLIEHLKESPKAEELEKKLIKIYDSHMGVPFLYSLYQYSIFPKNRKAEAEKELNTLLNVVNTPVEGFPDVVKKQKIKRT